MTIDVHAHVVPSELLGDGVRVWRDDAGQVVEVGEKRVRSAIHEIVDLDGILEAVPADRMVLCPFVPLLAGDVERLNDGLVRMVRARPDRVSALGAVPLSDPVVAAAELRALPEELRGVEIAADASLGDDRFEPFWAAAEETGTLVFIHPTTAGFPFQDFYLWNTVGNPFETTIAAAHMVMAGVMERHPGLRVLLAHGGGALLALRGRLIHSHGFQPQARSRLTESPADSLKRFYYDTVTHDVDLLRALVDYVGPGQVVLGSDYPFDMGDPRPAETVRACGFAPADEAAILGGTAGRLLGL